MASLMKQLTRPLNMIPFALGFILYRLYLNLFGLYPLDFRSLSIIPKNVNFPNANVKKQYHCGYQVTIDEYISLLSRQNYDVFNGDSIIDRITMNETNHSEFHPLTFQKYSDEFLVDSLQNTHITFIGDSIMYYLVNFILSQYHNYAINKSTSTMMHLHNARKIRETLKQRISLPDDLVDIGWRIFDEDKVEYLGFAEKGFEQTRVINDTLTTFDISDSMDIIYHNYPYDSFKYAQVLGHQKKTKVIVHNFGSLHLLHLHPWRKFELQNDEYFGDTTVNVLMHLEERLDEFMHSVESMDNLKCVILRSSNPVCDSLYERDSSFDIAAKFYHSIHSFSDAELLNIGAIRHCLKEYGLKSGTIASYDYGDGDAVLNLTGIDLCARYSLMSYGSMEINKRMKRWAHKKQRQLVQSKRNLKVIYFDAYRLYDGRCQYSRQTDGRHYQALEPLQTMALMNIVNNFC